MKNCAASGTPASEDGTGEGNAVSRSGKKQILYCMGKGLKVWWKDKDKGVRRVPCSIYWLWKMTEI